MKRQQATRIAMLLAVWAFAVAPSGSIATAAEQELPKRWSEEQAWQWYNKRPWIVGFNFVTSTAVNDLEMWQADTFAHRRYARHPHGLVPHGLLQLH